MDNSDLEYLNLRTVRFFHEIVVIMDKHERAQRKLNDNLGST